MAGHDRDTELGGDAREFPPTRHSAVRELASGEPVRRRAAQDALVRAYWKPSYAYARQRWRLANDDAKELVQGFFAHALEHDVFAGFDPARGRFRTFLRACFDHHAAHAHEAAQRVKRGGGARPLALDTELHDVVDGAATPEEELDACFRRELAREILALAIEGLRVRASARGKAAAFEVFARYDLHDAARGPRPTYDELAAELALPVTQVTNFLHWARAELRAIVLDELRAITRDESEAREEARWLLGGHPGTEDV